MYSLNAVLGSSRGATELAAISHSAASLGLAGWLLTATAAFVAFSLLDSPQPASWRARWLRCLIAALLLGAALLCSSLLSLLGLYGVQAPVWSWDLHALLAVTALLSCLGLDLRNRSAWIYALVSLPLAAGLLAVHYLLFARHAGAALNQMRAEEWLLPAALWISAVTLAFLLATRFRRRRSGSPTFLTVTASMLLATGAWAHHTATVAAMLSPEAISPPLAAAPFALFAGLALTLLIAAVFVSARRGANADSGGGSLRQGSRTDQVTGLPTLDVLSESFVRVLRLAVSGKGSVALAVLHFPGLDRIQSTHGRHERDHLYGLASWRLRSARREEELVGAMGDSRLLLVLRVSDASEAMQRMRDLLRLFETPVGEGKQRVRLRPSAGISLWPAHGDDFSRLLANALVALERCPPGGLQLFHATQREENEHRLRVETTLSAAIAQGELGLVLQPMIDALSGEVRMVELLARWNNSELGNVEPQQFILVAESTGVIGEFDRWLLREAISTTKWLDAAGFSDIRVALNCSPVNITDEAFLDFFEVTMQESGIDPTRIEVEVTEAALAEGEQNVVAALLRLRALGLGITIDDFGIGHSSLARLRDLPVDSLKIDQSFIADMDHPKGEFLVSGILGLAHGLGKAVIAEGVETEAQRAALTDLGCEYLQGFLISRPLSWRALLDFLGAEVGDDVQGEDDQQRPLLHTRG